VIVTDDQPITGATETLGASRASEAVRLLLRPPTPQQQALLAAVSEPFLEQGAWPVFDYVEAALDDQGLDAATIVNTFPSWHTRYSPVWPGPMTFIRPEDQVALTIAGLELHAAFSEEARRVVNAYLATLRYLAGRFRATPASPTTPRRLEVTSEELAAALREAGMLSPSQEEARRLVQISALVDREPTGWRSALFQPDAAQWTMQVGSGIRAYREVKTAEAYLERLAEPLFASSAPPVPAHPSSLSLPEAIDYLDTVWRLWFGEHLFRLPGAAKTAALALPCATSDEYDARLSALADLLGRMEPVRGGASRGGPAEAGSLRALEGFLEGAVPEAAQQRLRRALGTLRAVNNLRRGRQHHGADRDAPQAYGVLGIAYPPGDWGLTWDQIQMQAVEAFKAIREELQAFNDPA